MHFDSSKVERTGGFDPLPPGWYLMEITTADETENRAGTGRFVKIEGRVIDGDFENRRIFTRYNYQHENATAQRIAQERLADLCAAIGLKVIDDPGDLVGKPFMARLRVQASRDPNYGDSNEIVEFKAYETPRRNAAPQEQRTAPAAKPSTQPAKPATGDRPWTRRTQSRLHNDDVPY